jgi:hypothetical protein
MVLGVGVIGMVVEGNRLLQISSSQYSSLMFPGHPLILHVRIPRQRLLLLWDASEKGHTLRINLFSRSNSSGNIRRWRSRRIGRSARRH